MSETVKEGTMRINRVEEDLRWLLTTQDEMIEAGVDQDCAEKTALHLSKALDQVKRGHKCIYDGMDQQLRGPNKKDP